MRVLLSVGCDPRLQNTFNDTPLNLAEKLKLKEIRSLLVASLGLKDHGGEKEEPNLLGNPQPSFQSSYPNMAKVRVIRAALLRNSPNWDISKLYFTLSHKLDQKQKIHYSGEGYCLPQKVFYQHYFQRIASHVGMAFDPNLLLLSAVQDKDIELVKYLVEKQHINPTEEYQCPTVLLESSMANAVRQTQEMFGLDERKKKKRSRTKKSVLDKTFMITKELERENYEMVALRYHGKSPLQVAIDCGWQQLISYLQSHAGGVSSSSEGLDFDIFGKKDSRETPRLVESTDSLSKVDGIGEFEGIQDQIQNVVFEPKQPTFDKPLSLRAAFLDNSEIFLISVNQIIYREVVIEIRQFSETSPDPRDRFVGRAIVKLDFSGNDTKLYQVAVMHPDGPIGELFVSVSFSAMRDEDTFKKVADDYIAFDPSRSLKKMKKATQTKKIAKARAQLGAKPRFPIMIIPGLASSSLEVFSISFIFYWRMEGLESNRYWREFSQISLLIKTIGFLHRGKRVAKRACVGGSF